jgi:hypothetical protein
LRLTFVIGVLLVLVWAVALKENVLLVLVLLVLALLVLLLALLVLLLALLVLLLVPKLIVLAVSINKLDVTGLTDTQQSGLLTHRSE